MQPFRHHSSFANLSRRYRAALVWLLLAAWIGAIWPPAVMAQTLTHRYSFYGEPNGSLTATDTVAAANGTLQGGAAITGGKLVLNGSSGAYLNLPSGLITSGESAVTIETWASFGSLPLNCFFFGFGNTDSSGAGEDYIFCAPQAGRVAITGVDPGWQGEQNANAGVNWSGQTNLHVVAVFNPAGGYAALYTNGVLAAQNNAVTTLISAVSDVHSYIGRSLYTADPYAPLSVSEFRVYNGALSSSQIALDAAAGPAQLINNPGTLESVQLQVAGQMTAGSTQAVQFTGNFANVSNVNLFAYGQPTLVSSDSNVVSVTAAGILTAVGPGPAATITASYGGLTATQMVTVSGFNTNRFIYDSFGDGYWTIVNQSNNQVFVPSVSAGGQEPFTNGATEQQFELLYNYQNGTFRLRQRSSGFSVSAQNNAPKPGGAVTLGVFYTGISAQQWYLVDAGGGAFRIFNAASNLVMQTGNGTPAAVTLAAPSSSSAQLWQIQYQTNYFKKGCAGYEGDYAAFHLGWAYNYNDNTGVALPSSVDFVPMIYAAQYWEPLSDAQSRDAGWLTQSPPPYLLTYNEPDNTGANGGSNTSTNDAIALWGQIQALNVPLVSPAVQNTFDSWEYNFFSLIASNHYRVDYTAAHEYVPPNASSLISVLQSVYNTWGRPVWLTEFSPVDWSGNQGWTEDDDYNFLAEFMWMAEGQTWLKRYAIFPFSGTNPLPPYQSTTAGYRGNFFQSDGATLTPYGELYATWDGNTTLQTRTPYFIHNLGTSFRLISTNNAAGPQPATIYGRDATAQWALLPSPTTNQYYIISLNDGRRLRNNGGTPDLAPLGTIGPAVQWWFNGPDSKGYYYLDNLTASQSIRATGTAPAIAFSMINDPAPSSATQWRLIKPYQPVTIVTATPPVVAVSYTSQTAMLAWSGNGSFYNVYRSQTSGGAYTLIAHATTNTAWVDGSLQNGTAYYYVITALNILGEESGYSAEVVARPASTISPALYVNSSGLGPAAGLQFQWPADHVGWRLIVQTNDFDNGLSLNTNDWTTVTGSQATNQLIVSPDYTKPAGFYRLVYP